MLLSFCFAASSLMNLPEHGNPSPRLAASLFQFRPQTHFFLNPPFPSSSDEVAVGLPQDLRGLFLILQCVDCGTPQQKRAAEALSEPCVAENEPKKTGSRSFRFIMCLFLRKSDGRLSKTVSLYPYFRRFLRIVVDCSVSRLKSIEKRVDGRVATNKLETPVALFYENPVFHRVEHVNSFV